MCPHVDSIIFDKRAVKRNLKIQLDDGENLLGAIKEAMAQHKISECKVEDIEGEMKDGFINYFEGSSYKNASLANRKMLRASGTFRLNFGELWGTMHISTADKRPLSGTFVKGTAKEGLKIRLSFIDMNPQA